MKSTFGQALRKLRGQKAALDVAAMALGDSTETQRRDFANYLSKIEHDRIPNVGFRWLLQIAKGHGFVTLSSFFARIEALQNQTIAAHDALLDDTKVKEGLPRDSAIPPTPTDADRALYFRLGHLLIAAASTGAAPKRNVDENKRTARAPAKRGGKR